MAQQAELVNDLTSFFSSFSGNHYVRLLREGEKTYEFYGDTAAVIKYLSTVGALLNDADRRYNIYYAANDPAGVKCDEDAIGNLRCIYQDCDVPELAANEPELDGERAHITLETSPGKRQRIWHLAPPGLDKARQRAIHDHMVATRWHDPDTAGAARILRVPGFRNWSLNKDGSLKYPDGPVARILEIRNAPALTIDRAFAAFGFKAGGSVTGNVNGAAQRVQGSGEVPDNVIPLHRAKAHSPTTKDRENDSAAVKREVQGLGGQQVPVSDILDHLSMIDPDCDRSTWVKVISALHFMSDGAEWGQAIASVWSQFGRKWKPKDFANSWRNFRDQRSRMAHWGSLRTVARLNGFDPHKTKSIRGSSAFKQIQEEFGPVVTIKEFFVDYPVRTLVGVGGVSKEVIDTLAPQNIHYLLTDLCGAYCYYDQPRRETFILMNGHEYVFDLERLKDIWSVAYNTNFRITQKSLAEQIEAVAREKIVNPCADYLDKLPPWDGIPRIESMFIRHLGASDTPSAREVALLFMVGLVRRMRTPGYKFDMFPILEGPEGIGKSSFWRLLMPDERWFVSGLSFKEERKRLLQQLQGSVLVEFAELSGLKSVDIDAFKSFVTETRDNFTPNYATKNMIIPRQWLATGTTNNSEYIRTLTGARRDNIVPVNHKLDFDALIAERDHLFAEAEHLALFEYGDELILSSAAQADMKEIRDDRLDISSEIREIIEEFDAIPAGWVTKETIFERIGIPFNDRAKRTGIHQIEYKNIRQLLRERGWDIRKSKKYKDPYGKERVAKVMCKGGATSNDCCIVCNGGVLELCKLEPTIEDLLS